MGLNSEGIVQVKRGEDMSRWVKRPEHSEQLCPGEWKTVKGWMDGLSS